MLSSGGEGVNTAHKSIQKQHTTYTKKHQGDNLLKITGKMQNQMKLLQRVNASLLVNTQKAECL